MEADKISFDVINGYVYGYYMYYFDMVHVNVTKSMFPNANLVNNWLMVYYETKLNVSSIISIVVELV